MYPPIPLHSNPAAHLAAAHVHTRSMAPGFRKGRNKSTAPYLPRFGKPGSLEHVSIALHLGHWAYAWKQIEVSWLGCLVRALIQRCLGWQCLEMLDTSQQYQVRQSYVSNHRNVASVMEVPVYWVK